MQAKQGQKDTALQVGGVLPGGDRHVDRLS
jgi:hypothetical protein